MKGRTFKDGDIQRVQSAIEHLRMARNLLVAAGAMKPAMRVRSALKSAEGAQRHVYTLQGKAERAKGAA